MNFIILRAASATSSADQLIRVCIPIGCYNSMHTLLANQKTKSFCAQSGASCAKYNKIHSGLSLFWLGKVSKMKTSSEEEPDFFLGGGYRPVSPLLGRGVDTGFNIFRGDIDGFIIF